MTIKITTLTHEFEDYKKYIEYKFAQMLGKSHGIKTRLSRILNCQASYLSKVFAGKGQLSVENGLKIAQYLRLDGNETKYLMYLILKSRTNDDQMKVFLDTELRIILENLQSRNQTSA